MATNNEDEVEVEESLDLPVVEEGEEDLTDWKVEAQKLRDKAIASKERAKSLRDKLEAKDRAIEALATGSKKVEPSKTGKLDDAVLDFFDLKGYDDDQIKVFTTIMAKTGMSHREVIKDEYALARAEAIKREKEVKDATPSSTKRAGGQIGDIASAVEKFKETGVLPSDKTLADAVVDSIAKVGNDRLPPWQRS